MLFKNPIALLTTATTLAALGASATPAGHAAPNHIAAAESMLLRRSNHNNGLNTRRSSIPDSANASPRIAKRHHSRSKRGNSSGTCIKRKHKAAAVESPKKENKESKSNNKDDGAKKQSQTNNVTPISTSGLTSGAGLFSFVDDKCGSSGATEDVTKTTGPNGSMQFLNCGLNSGGWTPPMVQLKDLKTIALDDAVKDPSSVFQPCKPFVWAFDKYGAEYDLPPILIASIAMMESTCQPDVYGKAGGEVGLMQITPEKCTAGIDCADPDYNIRTGAKYLKDRLDENNGNVLLALGQYNGWYAGLTTQSATAIKDQCCHCQNNLNYHMGMLNGWLLGNAGYDLGDWNMGC